MRKVFLFIPLVFLFLNANAQSNEPENDWLLIQKTLNLYLDGQGTGDSVKIAKSFHSSWQLKYLADNKVNVMSKSQYIKGYKTPPYAKVANWSGRIVSIDITNTVAAAKVEISTPKLLFTDYFNLVKINEDWFIVDKISTRSPHKTVEVPLAKAKE
jgi:hypothetical protein